MKDAKALKDGHKEIERLETWSRPGPIPFHEFTEFARYNVAFDNVQQVLSDEEQDVVHEEAVQHLDQLRQSNDWPDLPAETRRAVLSQYLDLSDRLGDGVSRDHDSVLDAQLDLAELELDARNPEGAADLVRGALRVIREKSDDVLRAQKLLGHALLAAGKGAEAATALEQAAATASDAKCVSTLWRCGWLLQLD